MNPFYEIKKPRRVPPPRDAEYSAGFLRLVAITILVGSVAWIGLIAMAAYFSGLWMP